MNLIDTISRYCDGYRLPQDLVMAIAMVESSMSMSAMRFEPTYRWFWDCQNNKRFRRVDISEAMVGAAPDDFSVSAGCGTLDTEWMGQRTRWGPFQINGACLRERRYTGPFPIMCSDPDMAARFACAHISTLHERYFARHGWSGVVAAFDAGRPRKNNAGVYRNVEYLKRVADVNKAARFLPFNRG